MGPMIMMKYNMADSDIILNMIVFYFLAFCQSRLGHVTVLANAQYLPVPLECKLEQQDADCSSPNSLELPPLYMASWLSLGFFIYLFFPSERNEHACSHNSAKHVWMYNIHVCVCVSLSCTGRITVDLQGLVTMSRPTPGTHTQSLSQ